ncbi:MAG: hypothetical protein CMJ18_22060 [Phycisphaeraceae bacterium]|nr:hypothetical protein [Phycisphaeraceae bacterium]
MRACLSCFAILCSSLLVPVLDDAVAAPFADHGGAELSVDGPVLAPIRHKPMWINERDQFGYNPRYPAAPVTFGPDNRPYIWDGDELVTLNEEGRWISLEVVQKVQAKYGGIAGGPGANDPFLGFDADGDAYLLVRLILERQDVFRDSAPQRVDAFGFLHSGDGMQSWTFVETHPVSWYSATGPLPRKLYLGPGRLEHWQPNSQVTGPPPMVEGRGRELALYLPQKNEDGSMGPVKRLVVAGVKPPVVGKGRNWITPLHSGAGNVSATYGGRTHVVWLSIQPHEWHKEQVEALSAEMQGPYVPYALRYKDGLDALAPQYIRTYDHATGELGPRVLLGFSRRDNHDGPVIGVDSKGYLHVILGAHHDNFQYTRSLEPNSATGGWTEPIMFGTPRPAKGGGSYTYQAMVIDREDVIHLVSRSAANSGYYFNLAYNRKKPGSDWEPEVVLVHPFRPGYCAWRQKLTTDRLGRLFLSYAHYPSELTGEQKAAYHRKYPQFKGGIRETGHTVLMSDDGGDSWRLALTGDFVEGWRRGKEGTGN